MLLSFFYRKFVYVVCDWGGWRGRGGGAWKVSKWVAIVLYVVTLQLLVYIMFVLHYIGNESTS